MSTVVLVFVFIAAVVSAQVTSEIARDRGYSAIAWGLLGFLLPALAPVLIWLRPPNVRVWDRCEHCAEHVRPLAVVCAHCGREVDGVRAVLSDRPSSVPS